MPVVKLKRNQSLLVMVVVVVVPLVLQLVVPVVLQKTSLQIVLVVKRRRLKPKQNLDH